MIETSAKSTLITLFKIFTNTRARVSRGLFKIWKGEILRIIKIKGIMKGKTRICGPPLIQVKEQPQQQKTQINQESMVSEQVSRSKQLGMIRSKTFNMIKTVHGNIIGLHRIQNCQMFKKVAWASLLEWNTPVSPIPKNNLASVRKSHDIWDIRFKHFTNLKRNQ